MRRFKMWSRGLSMILVILLISQSFIGAAGAVTKPSGSKQKGNVNIDEEDIEVLGSIEIPAATAAALTKGFERFRDDFIRAEMSLRYYLNIGKEGKVLSPQQLKVLRDRISRNLKKLQSSATSYAMNIEMAKLAMLKMDEEERSLFAQYLSFVLGTPAWAASRECTYMLGTLEENVKGAGLMARNADALIAGTAPKELQKQLDEEMAKNPALRALASACKLAMHAGETVVGVALALLGIGATAAAFANPVVGTLAAVAFFASVTGLALSVSHGSLQMTIDMAHIAEASGIEIDPEDIKTLEEADKYVSIANFIMDIPGVKSKIDLFKTGVMDADDAKELIDMILDASSDDETGEALKEEFDDALSDFGGGSSGGGGGSGGGGSGGCGCD